MDAVFIQTSTQCAAQHLTILGTEAQKLLVIRRGLNAFPDYKPIRSPRNPIRLLSVGRLIEKKGYFKQLEIYQALKSKGIPFLARIIGAGPLHEALHKQVIALNLQESVTFLGEKSYSDILKQYNWSDLFIYTGKIAASGDRDGLPNVIPEAMAVGNPVIASRAAGVCEALQNHQNGIPNQRQD